MTSNFLKNMVRRSRLIMPANQRKFVEKAYLRNADAVVLDLEDSVPITEKLATRGLIKEFVPVVAKGGSDVLIRINHIDELLYGDLEASVWPKVSGIVLPKVETGEQVKALDNFLTELEQKRGIPNRQLTISVLIETAKGYLNLEKIVQASERIDSVTLGLEDFSRDCGIEQSEETAQGLLIPRMQVVLVARAYGKVPMGLLGSLANYKDASRFEKNALLAFKHGYLGASCIHPANVEILNRAFSPSGESVTYSQRVMESFEKALAEGRASTILDGKMIDYVHYEKAKQVFERHGTIQEFENKKRLAREAVAIGG